jgi:hypothetical protein
VPDYQRLTLSRLIVHDCAVADRALKPCRGVKVRETMTKKRRAFLFDSHEGFNFFYDIVREVAHGFDLVFTHLFLFLDKLE